MIGPWSTPTRSLASPIFTGVASFADGAQGAPSIAATNYASTGLYWTSGPGLNVSINGSRVAYFDTTAFVPNIIEMGGGGGKLQYGGATGQIALYNGTTAQELHVYNTRTSATDYHRSGWKTASATLSNVSGATVTATNLIPAGAFVIGVTTKVTTGLGVSNGTTGYQVGDGSDADRWGDITGTAAGTSSDNTSATANFSGAFTAATSVVLTAKTGNFDATGVIYVTVHYFIAQAD